LKKEASHFVLSFALRVVSGNIKLWDAAFKAYADNEVAAPPAVMANICAAFDSGKKLVFLGVKDIEAGVYLNICQEKAETIRLECFDLNTHLSRESPADDQS
jgi:hypothetical protein